MPSSSNPCLSLGQGLAPCLKHTTEKILATVPEEDYEEGRQPNARSLYPRKRAVTACQTCRERKKKCDNERPSCGFCLRIGGTCEYVSKDKSTFDPASLAILDRLAVLESLIRNEQRGSLPSTAGHTLNAAEESLPEKLARSMTLPSLTQINTDSVLSWPVVQKALSTLKKYSFLDRNGNSYSTYLSISIPGISFSSSMSQDGRLATVSNFPFERGDIEPLVDRFFKEVHTKNPILSRATVQQACEELYEQGPMWDTSTCLVLIVCALGSIAQPFEYREYLDTEGPNSYERADRLSRVQMANSYFTAAEKRVGFALTNPGILSVHCLCLAGIYHMYTLNHFAAHAMFHAAGTALQVLVATSEAGPSDSILSHAFSSEIQRLFWTCFKSEREILAEVPFGQLAMTHFELSEQYPSPPQNKSTQPSMDPWQRVEDDSWYYYLSEIALRRISDNTVSTMFSENGTHDFTHREYPIKQLIPTALEFHRQLDAWHASLPPSIAFPLSLQPLKSELQYFLRSRYFLLSELFHRPFICYAIHNQSSASTEVMEMAQKGLTSALNYLLHSNHTHRHHGKWLQLRRELTATSLLLAGAAHNLDMPQGWYDGVKSTKSHMRYWNLEAPYASSYLDVISTMESYSLQLQQARETGFSDHMDAVGSRI